MTADRDRDNFYDGFLDCYERIDREERDAARASAALTARLEAGPLWKSLLSAEEHARIESAADESPMAVWYSATHDAYAFDGEAPDDFVLPAGWCLASIVSVDPDNDRLREFARVDFHAGEE